MTTTAPAVWPLDTVNVYSETLAAAIARTEAAVESARTALGRCYDDRGDVCEGSEEFHNARNDLLTLRSASRDEFSLDGVNDWTWTILADSATEAAGRAEDAACHD